MSLLRFGLSLRGKILLLTLCLVISGLVALTIISFAVAKTHTLALLNQQSQALLDAHAEAIAGWIGFRKQTVSAVVSDANERKDALHLHLKQVKQVVSAEDVYVGYPDKGFADSANEDTPTITSFDPTSRPWYQLAVAHPDVVLTDPYIDATSQKLVLTFASAIGKGDQFRGVVGLDVLMDDVVKIVHLIRPTTHSYGFIVNRDGKILVHENPAMLLKNLRDLAPTLQPDALQQQVQQRTLVTLLVGKEKSIVGAIPIDGTDWILIMVSPESEALEAIQAMLKSSIMVVLAIALLVIVISTYAMNRMTRRLGVLSTTLQDISSGEGDLSQRLRADGKDELAAIGAGFNTFVDKLQDVLVRVQASASGVAMASADIAHGNRDLSERTHWQAEALKETAVSMSDLSTTVQNNAQNAHEANGLANSASKIAIQGGEVVGQVVKTMNRINESAHRIADIISVIDGIAFQTNILALNAAVEAARAGEQGRGFAVVASEVRSLAGRSAAAAKEIKTLIGTSVEWVTQGSALVNQAGQTMTEVVSAISRVTHIVGAISAASSAQAEGVVRIGQAVTHMDHSTQQNTQLVKEMATAANSLESQAQDLVDTVATFRV